MYKKFYLKTMLLLLALIVGNGSAWAEENQEEEIASFSASTYYGGTTNGWSVSNSDYASAGGGYYKLTSSDAMIVTPSIEWSNYSTITITISARKFGGPDATQGKISVSQGENELNFYSPSGTSIAASSPLSIAPSDGSLKISCPGASSGKGCGVGSIVIKGTPKNASNDPVISVSSFSILLDYNATSGEIDYTITNPVENTPLSATTDANWISNITVGETSVTFSTTANDGNGDRVATITLSYTGAESRTVTVTQKHHVVDYATLPFRWAGGAKAGFLALNGVTSYGLGSDYAEGNAPYRIKLDTTGDYIQVKTDSQPGKVTIGVKMIGGNTSSTITVQGSADGNTFTDVEALTISGDQNDVLTLETTNSFAVTDRYVRLLFTKGDNVGVGPITIDLPSTDPVINASDINLSYGSTSGNIQYTIDNPVDGGALSASTDSDWLTVSNESGNWMYNAPENTTASERTATVTLTYTYNTNLTVTKDITITQAGAPMTIAEVRAQGTGENVETIGVVTSCVGVTAYIQDETAAICVYGDTDHPINFAVGDEIAVEGTLAEYKGLVEIKYPVYSVLSQGNTVEPEVMTIAEINADYAANNELQGWLVRIENATVTAIDGDNNNTTIAQGENTIVVHGISGVEYAVDDILTLTGNIGCYNNAQIANPTNVQVQETPRVEYYLAGSFATTQEWKDDMKKLTQNQDGTYSITMNDFSAGTAFKIVRKNLDNSLTWFGGQSDNNTYEIHNLWWKDIQMVQDNKNFTIPTSGNYTFTVNVTAMKLTVTGWTYTLKGSFDEWAAGETFTSQGNGVYTLTKELTAVTTFKIVDERNNYYSNGAFSKDNCTDLAIYTDNADMTIAEASEYVFTLTTDNNSIKLTVTGWPVVVEGDKFVKVTSTDDLTSGQYLIVYEGANVAFDGSLETLDAISNTIAVGIVNDANDGNTIVANNDNVKSVFAIDTTAGTIKSASGKYIGKTSSGNGLDTNAQTIYTNTFSIDEDGNAVITASGGSTLRFNSASNQARFRYYGSGQQPIQLYKLVHETTPEVTFSENAEDNSVIAANELLVVNATLERTLSNSFWSTFSVPFNVTADQVTAVLGEGVGLRKFQGSEGTVIKFQEATTIEAGHAYLVKPAETVTNPVFEGVTVVNTTGVEDSDTNGYGFVGAVIKKTLKVDETELFLGTDGKFYYPETEAKATMKGLRGYFVVPAGTETSKLSVDVEGSGIATSINSMNIEGMGDGNIYNLNGQRVNAPQKGLYIVNGKKVIIK